MFKKPVTISSEDIKKAMESSTSKGYIREAKLNDSHITINLGEYKDFLKYLKPEGLIPDKKPIFSELKESCPDLFEYNFYFDYYPFKDTVELNFYLIKHDDEIGDTLNKLLKKCSNLDGREIKLTEQTNSDLLAYVKENYKDGIETLKDTPYEEDYDFEMDDFD